MKSILGILGLIFAIIGSIMDVIFGLLIMPLVCLSYWFKFKYVNHFLIYIRFIVTKLCTSLPLSMMGQSESEINDDLKWFWSMIKAWRLQ